MSESQGEWLRKRRRCGSEVLIVVGNWYLRWIGAVSCVLASDEWIRWERAVHAALRPDAVVPTSERATQADVTLRAAAGRPLVDVLRNREVPIDQKLTAFRLAVAALDSLHQCRVDRGNGTIETLSHGDATAENVFVDLHSESSEWIDFDTRHLSRLNEIERRSDDLRALLFSSAASCGREDYVALVSAAVASYSKPLVLAAVRSRFANGGWRHNTFELAQAPLSWDELRTLRTEILRITPDYTVAADVSVKPAPPVRQGRDEPVASSPEQ